MAKPKDKNIKTAAVLFSVAAGMVGLSFASVPLYEIFCKVTGIGGTPGQSAEAPKEATNVPFSVRFDANTNPGLDWRFEPLQREIKLNLGEEKLAFYRATNLSDKPITGTATFNVTPLKVGRYFVKIECFCFTEQTLKPGESVEMPVSFYVEPDIYENVNNRDVKTITLSYTFFPVEDGGAKVSVVPKVETSGSEG